MRGAELRRRATHQKRAARHTLKCRVVALGIACVSAWGIPGPFRARIAAEQQNRRRTTVRRFRRGSAAVHTRGARGDDPPDAMSIARHVIMLRKAGHGSHPARFSHLLPRSSEVSTRAAAAIAL